MEDLAAEVDQSCTLARFAPPNMVYLACVEAPDPVTIAFGPGDSIPVYESAMGLVTLASLPPEELDDYLVKWPLQQLFQVHGCRVP